jgi:hypothetical protein
VSTLPRTRGYNTGLRSHSRSASSKFVASTRSPRPTSPALSRLAQVLDFAGVQPNPARDKVQVRRARVLAARSASPADLAATPGRRSLGSDRRHVGQRNLAVTANTYTHVLIDETELECEALVGW